LSEDVEEKLFKYIADFISNQSLPNWWKNSSRIKRLKYRDAARMVYVLWKQRALELSESKPPSTLIGYAVSL
jgi:hypothetical protein